MSDDKAMFERCFKMMVWRYQWGWLQTDFAKWDRVAQLNMLRSIY